MSNVIFAQKMVTRTGAVKFEASTPLESIAAVNNAASCILNKDNGELAALVLIKGFQFKSPLMQEHFNENYMESSKYPKATFKGKILNFDASKLTAQKNSYDLEGELMIHGVSKKVKTKISLSLNNGKIDATGSFNARPQDYNIEIPRLVKDKIAETAKIDYSFVLEAK